MDARERNEKNIPVVKMECAQCGNPNGPYIQQANGVIKSLNYTEAEEGSSLISDGGISDSKWYCADCTKAARGSAPQQERER